VAPPVAPVPVLPPVPDVVLLAAVVLVVPDVGIVLRLSSPQDVAMTQVPANRVVANK
jgi:hypothetical protein